ncbi:MAG: RNA 2'-phosphotransferase [Candidatus Aminicenantia bacterium]
MKTTSKTISKYMSYILRHQPNLFNLKMDKYGFVPLNEFIKSIQKKYPQIGLKEKD